MFHYKFSPHNIDLRGNDTLSIEKTERWRKPGLLIISQWKVRSLVGNLNVFLEAEVGPPGQEQKLHIPIGLKRSEWTVQHAHKDLTLHYTAVAQLPDSHAIQPLTVRVRLVIQGGAADQVVLVVDHRNLIIVEGDLAQFDLFEGEEHEEDGHNGEEEETEEEEDQP